MLYDPPLILGCYKNNNLFVSRAALCHIFCKIRIIFSGTHLVLFEHIFNTMGLGILEV